MSTEWITDHCCWPKYLKAADANVYGGMAFVLPFAYSLFVCLSSNLTAIPNLFLPMSFLTSFNFRHLFPFIYAIPNNSLYFIDQFTPFTSYTNYV